MTWGIWNDLPSHFRPADRTLTRADFTDAPVKNPDDPNNSDRLRNRLTTNVLKGIDGVLTWLAEGMVEKLPADKREAMIRKFKDQVLRDGP